MFGRDEPYMNTTLKNTGKLTVGLKWDKGAVYIGRGSDLGNPFQMKNKTEKERTRVLKLYEVWLRGQFKKYNYKIMFAMNDLADKLLSGEDVHLGCYCKHKNNPKRCHGDIIKKVLYQVTNEQMDYIPF